MNKFLRLLSEMSDENLHVLCTVHLDYNLFYQQQLQPFPAGAAGGSGATAAFAVPRLPLSLTPDSATPLIGSARQPSIGAGAGAGTSSAAAAAQSSNAGAAGSNSTTRSSSRLPPTGRRSASARRA